MTEQVQVAADVLTVQQVEISFGGVRPARGIDLTLHANEHFAIIGQNGAGKSTFLNICTGYLKPSHGRVIYAGRDITGLHPRRIARLGIARAFQHPQLFDRQTVVDNMRFAVAARGGLAGMWRALHAAERDAEVWQLLALFRLDALAGHRVADLSEGSRKLLDVAMALALQPGLLLMDEPTSGVSSDEKFALMDILLKALTERDVTAVFVEHDMSIVRRYAQRVGAWVDGEIIATGRPDDVLDAPDVREAIL